MTPANGTTTGTQDISLPGPRFPLASVERVMPVNPQNVANVEPSTGSLWERLFGSKKAPVGIPLSAPGPDDAPDPNTGLSVKNVSALRSVGKGAAGFPSAEVKRNVMYMEPSAKKAYMEGYAQGVTEGINKNVVSSRHAPAAEEAGAMYGPLTLREDYVQGGGRRKSRKVHRKGSAKAHRKGSAKAHRKGSATAHHKRK